MMTKQNETPKTWKDRDRDARDKAHEERVLKEFDGVGFLEHVGSKRRFPANREGKRRLARYERQWRVERMQQRAAQVPGEAAAIAAERRAGEMRRRSRVEAEYQQSCVRSLKQRQALTKGTLIIAGGDPYPSEDAL